MGIPYQLTANDQQHILSYGGGASQTMPININYQATSGESYSTVIGYMRPVLLIIDHMPLAARNHKLLRICKM